MPVLHLPAMASKPELSGVKNEPSDLFEQPYPVLPGNQNQTNKPLPAHQGSLVKPSQPLLPKVVEVVKDSVDISSIRGLFGWATVDGVSVPYLLRDEKKYVAVRIVEQKLLARFPNTFPEELGRHEPLVSYYVTQNEMKLLDEINSVHCDFDYGRNKFTGKDLIVKLSEFEDFYNLVKRTFPQEVLHARKAGVPLPAPEVLASSKSGWIQVNNTVTPYFRRGLQKYVVLQIIRHAAKLLDKVEVENICPNEEEYTNINAMCSSAGLAFKFSKSTKLVSLDDVKLHHEVTLMELPLKCPMKYAQYNNAKKEEVQNEHSLADQVTTPAVPPSLLRNIAMPTQMPVEGHTLPNPNDMYVAQGEPPPRQALPPPAAQQMSVGQHGQLQRLPIGVGQYPMHPAFQRMTGPNIQPHLQPQMPGSQQFSSIQQQVQVRPPQGVHNFPMQSMRPAQHLPTSTANNATGFGMPSRPQVSLNQNPQSLHPLGTPMFTTGVVPHPQQQGIQMPVGSPYGNQIPSGSQQTLHMGQIPSGSQQTLHMGQMPVVSQHGIQMVRLPQQTLQQHPSMMLAMQQNRLAVTSQNFVPTMVPGLMRPQVTQQMPVVSSPFAQSQGYVQQPLQQQSTRPPQSALIRQPQQRPPQQQSTMIRPPSQRAPQQQSTMIRPPSQRAPQQQSAMIRPPPQRQLQQQSTMIRPPPQRQPQQQSTMIRHPPQNLPQQQSLVRPPLQKFPQNFPQQNPPHQTPPLQNPSLQNPSLQNPSLQNPSLQNPSLQNPSLQNPSLQNSPLQNPPLTQPHSTESPRMANNQNAAAEKATHFVIPIVDPTVLNNDMIPNMNKILQRPPFASFHSPQQKQSNSKNIALKKSVFPKIAPRYCSLPTAHVPSSEALTLKTDDTDLNSDGDKAELKVLNGGDKVGLMVPEQPVEQTAFAPDNESAPEALEVVKLSKCVSGVRFEGRSISCLEYDDLKGKHALIEAVCKLYFPRWKLQEFLYVLEQVLKIPTKACQPNEEKAFIHYYHLPVPVLKCNKMVKLDDLSEHYTKLLYMFGKINGASKSPPECEELRSGGDSPVIVAETLAPKDGDFSSDKDVIPLGSPVPLHDDSTEKPGGIKRKHLSGSTQPSKQLKRLEDAVERLKQRPDPPKEPLSSTSVNDGVSVIVIE